MNKNQNNCLVTGATGFLGRVVVEKLAQCSAKVTCLSRRGALPDYFPKNTALFRADISSRFRVPGDIKTIYHCAGTIDQNDDSLKKNNIEGTRNVISAAKKSNCQLVHVSSAGVIGKSSFSIINENEECKPKNAYECSKFEAEKLVIAAAKSGLRAQIIRPTIIFGPGRNPQTDSFLQLIKAIKKGKYFNIGNGVYNIIYVEEVARAMITLAQSKIENGQIYFLNTPISFRAFARVINFATKGITIDAPNLPYSLAFASAGISTIFSSLIKKKMPLTISRLKALNDKRVFSQRKIISDTTYRPESSLYEQLIMMCKQYVRLGLL